MNINELTGLPIFGGSYEHLDKLAAAIIESLSQQSDSHQILIDPCVSKNEREAFQQACEKYQYQLLVKDAALFGKADDTAAFIVAYPNCEGNIEDYSDLSESLHEQQIRLVMACQAAALPLLKSPASMGADIAYCQVDDNYLLCCQQACGEAQPAAPELSQLTSEEAARMHGLCAYLNDALEVYGYEQENNAFFNTLKIRLPENCSQTDFKQIAEAYELDYQPCEDDFILVSICQEDDSESLEAIIECLAEAGDNFGVPVEDEDWSSICALDGSLLR